MRNESKGRCTQRPYGLWFMGAVGLMGEVKHMGFLSLCKVILAGFFRFGFGVLALPVMCRVNATAYFGLVH